MLSALVCSPAFNEASGNLGPLPPDGYHPGRSHFTPVCSCQRIQYTSERLGSSAMQSSQSIHRRADRGLGRFQAPAQVLDGALDRVGALVLEKGQTLGPEHIRVSGIERQRLVAVARPPRPLLVPRLSHGLPCTHHRHDGREVETVQTWTREFRSDDPWIPCPAPSRGDAPGPRWPGASRTDVCRGPGRAPPWPDLG
jgi:hypothetical protein